MKKVAVCLPLWPLFSFAGIMLFELAKKIGHVVALENRISQRILCAPLYDAFNKPEAIACHPRDLYYNIAVEVSSANHVYRSSLFLYGPGLFRGTSSGISPVRLKQLRKFEPRSSRIPQPIRISSIGMKRRMEPEKRLMSRKMPPWYKT